jgi:lysophospholipase L1-like esterase
MAVSKNKKINAGLVVLFIILVCDIVLAQALKYSTDFWIATYPPMNYRIRSDKFHHDLVKNRVVNERWGAINYSFFTNSLGFKDSEIREVPLQVNKTRILFIGDSFTEGSGFSYQDTFVGKIATHYKQKNIDVLNAGVASYAPEVYFRKVRYLVEDIGLKFNHVVVFIDVSDIHDEIALYKLDKNQNLVVPEKERSRNIDQFGHWLRDNSSSARLFTLIRDNLSFLKKNIKRRLKTAKLLKKSYWDVTTAEMTVNAIVPHFASEWSYKDSAWKGTGKAGRKKAVLNMNRLFHFLKSKNIRLTIAVYPWPDQLINDPKAPKHREFWGTWAKNKNISMVDLFPLFTKDNPYEVLNHYFLRNDVHWNRAGHNLVAMEFLRQFKIPD